MLFIRAHRTFSPNYLWNRGPPRRGRKSRILSNRGTAGRRQRAEGGARKRFNKGVLFESGVWCGERFFLRLTRSLGQISKALFYKLTKEAFLDSGSLPGNAEKGIANPEVYAANASPR